MAHTDEEWLVNVNGTRIPVLVRSPDQRSARPALLIQLALARGAGLDETTHSIVPKAMLAAGHQVASFDLPNEGDLIDEHGQGLGGLAGAMAAGNDFVARLISIGRAVVDAWSARESGPIILTGISRGGFMALHLFAAEPRFLALATFAPVTNLLAVREFTHLDQNPVLLNNRLIDQIPAIANRPTFCAITEIDARVSTEECIALHERIRRAAPALVEHRLRIDPGETHSVAPAAYQEGAAWLLSRLNDERMRPTQ